MNKCIIFSWSEGKKTDIIVNEGDLVICADSGIYFAEKFGIFPDLVVGDFDSSDLSEIERLKEKGAEIIKLPKEKDVTDTYFAVSEGFKRGYKNFSVLGGIGGRLDHTLANLSVLHFIYNNGGTGDISDGNSHIYYIPEGGSLQLQYDERCEYISVFPVNNVSYGVTETGMKYSLDNATLGNDNPVGISNEFIPGNKAVISVEKGPLYVIKILR